ncbi:hypothetical protein ACFW1M_08465 [Streptomyces inhibens]|uniref:hypothetical protein n=1 Tax=Streptomyces inhibens TaxID=2293571 RepID=UPI00368EE106
MTTIRSGAAEARIREAFDVEDPAGGRWAVAVFTRSDRPDLRSPRAEQRIGQVPALAVDGLRSPTL